MSLLTPKTIVISTIPGRQTARPIAISVDLMMDEGIPKKRRRLTHMTPDEKMLRRKLKNRVAAQTARDRKKAQMGDLEIKIAKLESENKKLYTENKKLKTHSSSLLDENTALKERLGQVSPSGVSSGVSSVCVRKPEPPRSAEGTDPGSLTCSHDALCSILPHAQSDVLLGLLEQFHEESISESQAQTTTPSALPVHKVRANPSVGSVVGPSSAELESLNELIKFDHIYFKADPDAAKSSRCSQTDSNAAQVAVQIAPLEMTEASGSDPEQMDVPTINITDVESIEDGSGLELLEDIESLLQSEDLLDVADVDPSIFTGHSEVEAIDSVCRKPKSLKRKHCSASGSSSGAEEYTKFEDTLQEYFSDSGISVPSPTSDLSSCLGDDSWEESFTDLFPDLL